MKILFILLRFQKNGHTTNVLELAEGFIERGHEVHLITAGFKNVSVQNDDDQYFDSLKNDMIRWGTKIHYFKESDGNIIQKGILSVLSTLKILYLINKVDADIIHCHSPMSTFLPWLLRRKFVTTVHTDTIRPNPWYKHPNIVIAVSEGSKEFTETVMHSDPDTVRIVHHGISTRFAEPIRKEELDTLIDKNNIPANKLLVGFVGRITPGKGLDTLIDAIKNHLPATTLEKIHLIFVGNCDSVKNEEWIHELIETNNLQEKITLLPFQDPKPWYQIFDLFVLPSRIDTFGLVAVEAMLSNCCIIRSDSYGAHDQIDHGKNGFIFKMNDDQELAKYMEIILNDSKKRQELARAGKQKVLENFTNDIMIERTLDVYKELTP